MNSFARRATARSAVLLIPVVLTFVAAGTLRFWQGWFFWVTFTSSSTALGIYFKIRDPALIERRMKFGPQAETRPRQKIIVAIVLATFFALPIIAGLDHRFGWSRVPTAIAVLANLLIVGIFGFFLLVLRANSFAASTITVEPGQRVISTGAYAYVRHPMYLGGILMFAAIPLAMGSLCAIPVAAIAVPALIARTLDEERALSAELPGYDDYRHAVPWRLIPRVW